MKSKMVFALLIVCTVSVHAMGRRKPGRGDAPARKIMPVGGERKNTFAPDYFKVKPMPKYPCRPNFPGVG